MCNGAFASVRSLDDSPVEKEKFLRVVARLVVDVDMRRKVRRFALISPPGIVAPRSFSGEKELKVES